MSAYTGAVLDTNWKAKAACAPATVNPALFEAGEKEHDKVKQARAICGRCPSRTPCLLAGYLEDDDTTIRAGLTPRQRAYHLSKAGRNIPRAVANALGNATVLLQRIYRQHARPDRDGHMVWTDRRHLITVRGETYTVHQLAWIALHGARPVGSVQRVCDVDGCVAKGCLTDRKARERAARSAVDHKTT